MHRLLENGEITRDTLVWRPAVGPKFVKLGDTSLTALSTEPPPLPASAVDNTLVWVLVAIPIASAILERIFGQPDTPSMAWPIATFLLTIFVGKLDERRVLRSGVSDRSISLGPWVWLVPVYLAQRARALNGPRLYVWAWLASFVAALLVDVGGVMALVRGDVYLGTGLPACNSNYQIRQVRKMFDGLEQIRAAGLTSTGVTNAREHGTARDVRTCAAQISLSNATSYAVIYVVERTGDQLVTNLQAIVR